MRRLTTLSLALSLGLGAARSAPRSLVVLDAHSEIDLAGEVLAALGDAVRGEALALPANAWFVLTRERVLQALPPNTTLAECLGECELETGRRLGAEVVVTGEVAQVGARNVVSLKAHDTKTGRFLAQATEGADALSGLPDAAVAAARVLFGILLDRPKPGEVAVATPYGPSLGEVHLELDDVPIGPAPLIGAVATAQTVVRLAGECVHPREVRGPVTGESLQIHLTMEPRLRPLHLTLLGNGQPEPGRIIVDKIDRGALPGVVHVPLCAEMAHFRGAGGWGFRADLPPPTVEMAEMEIPEREDRSLGWRVAGTLGLFGGMMLGASYFGGEVIGPSSSLQLLQVGGIIGMASGLFVAWVRVSTMFTP